MVKKALTYSLILCISLLSGVSYAQKKLTLIKKDNVTTSTPNASNAQRPKPGKGHQGNYRRNIVKAEPEPPYVYINGTSDQSSTLTHQGGAISYTMSTNVTDGLKHGFYYRDHDGLKEMDANWCHFQQLDDNHFALNVDKNNTYSARGTIFMLGDQNDEATARITIAQGAKPITASGNITHAALRHNVELANGKKYLEITANVALSNAKDLNFLVFAYLQDENGTDIQVKGNYPLNTADGSKLVAYSNIQPTVENYNGSVKLQLPNEAMSLWKSGSKHKLDCKLIVQCIESNKVVSQTPYSIPFKTKEKKKQIVTENR